MVQDINQRRHQRLSAELAVYIEVQSAGHGSTESGHILRTETVDVSASGFRVWSPQEMPEDAVLQIAAEFPGTDEVLVLAAEVRWTQTADYDDGFWIGFQLFNASDSDIDKWHHLISKLHERAG